MTGSDGGVQTGRPEPFTIAVPDSDLADLHQRLERTRWPDPATGPAWDQGTDDGFLRSLVARWRQDYDWRAHEAEFNRLPQFRVELGGRRVHYQHVPGVGPDPLPVLLSHGAFSNVHEFHHVVPRLTDPGRYGGDPADAVDVVAWSLPGFGWSDPPRHGTNLAVLADLAHTLMTDVLGYSRFAAAGGSWGGLITSLLGLRFPDSMIGLYLTQANPPSDPRGPGRSEADLSPAERQLVAETAEFVRREGGYQRLLSTRPQSLAFAVADSPAGLAGWFADKLRLWSDCDGELGSGGYSLEDLLTMLSITWFSGTIAAGQRLYWESARHDPGLRGSYIDVPTAVLALPHGMPNERTPAETIRRSFDLRHYVEAPAGGHYPGFDIPEFFAADMLTFFRTLRGLPQIAAST